MAHRRIIYLTALCGCVVFYWAYREWLSWFLLVSVALLPWLSLLLSLPAMLGCRVKIHCPAVMQQNEQAAVLYKGWSAVPVTEIRGKLRVSRILTGESWILQNGQSLPSKHCGALHIQPHRIWVLDYLGLLRLRVRPKEAATVLVRPQAVPVVPAPDISRYLAGAWKPKSGGGFSENHELRLYRPGDSLRQVHWKLSAKTGKMIFREAMEATRGTALLTLELTGTPDALDHKLGVLRYMCTYLLENAMPHHIHCLTGTGMEHFYVANEADALGALDALLKMTPADPGMVPNYMAASWRYHIGGDGSES